MDREERNKFISKIMSLKDINYKEENYYSIVKRDFEYTRAIQHEANRNQNESFRDLSGKLFTTSSIVIAFIPFLVSFLEEPISITQKVLLTLGILLSFFSMIFCFINHLMEQKFWKDTTNKFQDITRYLDLQLTKMQNDPSNTDRYYIETIENMTKEHNSQELKSNDWAFKIQFSFLLGSILSLISCYLIAIF